MELKFKILTHEEVDDCCAAIENAIANKGYSLAGNDHVWLNLRDCRSALKSALEMATRIQEGREETLVTLARITNLFLNTRDELGVLREQLTTSLSEFVETNSNRAKRIVELEAELNAIGGGARIDYRRLAELEIKSREQERQILELAARAATEPCMDCAQAAEKDSMICDLRRRIVELEDTLVDERHKANHAKESAQ